MDITLRPTSDTPRGIKYTLKETSGVGFIMGQLDTKAVEANFEGWRNERVPDLKVSEAFERYVIEAVLRNAELGDAEITSGMMGGGDDGGVDGAYFFVNRRLVVEGFTIPENVTSADLWLIQAKYSPSFGEAAVTKLRDFAVHLLDFDADVSELSIYSKEVKEFIELFREILGNIIGNVDEININFIYSTKSLHEKPSKQVSDRINGVKPAISKFLSSADVNFELWNAKRLLEAWRKQPERYYSLEVVNHFSHGDSFVGMARLDKFAEFLTDEKGELRQNFLEPNVRDYQGPNIKVNGAIRQSLDGGKGDEFWVLNNGVTILTDNCHFGGGKLNIKSPELVNGLQTSVEIFNYHHKHKGDDPRTVLVRVITPPSEAYRRRIIKATNNQTPVNAISLSANDEIQFDIEELFRLNGLYYDRRKGEYRRKRMPVSQIVSMNELAQSVIAIVLRKPDDARARPAKYYESDESLAKVFDPGADRRLFLACIRIDRTVKAYLGKRKDIDKDVRTDVRYYMDLWMASHLAGKSNPTKAELSAIESSVVKLATEALLQQCLKEVQSIYIEAGGDDKAAKGSKMRENLIKKIEATA